MSEWIDCTSYSRGDKDRTPQSWEMKLGTVRLVVTRTHGVSGIWFIDNALTGRRELKSRAIEDAKNEAIEWLRRDLKAAVNALPGPPPATH